MTVCALSVRWGEQLRPEVPLPRHPGVPLQRGLRGDEVAPGEGPRRGGRFLLRPMRLQVQLQGPAEQAQKNSLIYQDQVSSLAVVCIPGLCFSFFAGPTRACTARSCAPATQSGWPTCPPLTATKPRGNSGATFATGAGPPGTPGH